MSNSNMDIPDYLTKELLKKILEDNLESKTGKIEIKKFEIENPVPKGANYLSTILRINIEFWNSTSTASDSIEKISLIGKLPLKDGALSPLTKNGINEKEVRAYNKLLPKISKIIKSCENDVDVIPNFFNSGVVNTIFLEDLAGTGYKMADKTKQLDYEHGVVVMVNLARFHAASVKLHEIEPEIVEELGTDHVICKDMDHEIKKILEPMMGEAHIEMLCNEFEKWPETRKFVEFLTKLKPKIWDIFLNSIYPSDGEFSVLNHGDLWTNNMLFKYDDNSKPQYLKFLDFQILRYTSPTMDILNFFHTSIRYDVLKVHFHDFTNIYLEHLNQNLEKYGSSKRLHEGDFRRSLERREIFSLIQCVNTLPFVHAQYNFPDDKEDGSDGTPSEIPLGKFLQNESFRTVCAKYLEDFSKKPWYRDFE